MDKTIEFYVKKKDNGERLDVFLSKEITNLTRSYIKKLIEKNKVIIKSTSPESDFIIMCVNTDKKINMIQIREPIKFEDITSLKIN